MRVVAPLRSVRSSIALAVLIWTPVFHAAQHDSPVYADIVDAYTRGRFKEAASQLSKWPQPASLARVAHDFAATASIDQVQGAVMLHTDLALALFDSVPRQARNQLDLAHQLVRGLRPTQTDDFKRRWYALAASIYTSQGFLQDAARDTIDGLSEFPH